MKYILMPPLKDIAAVKVAVDVCNHIDVKKEILCAHWLDYDTFKSGWNDDRKKQWNNIVEKKAVVVIESLCLPKQLEERVANMINPIAMRMLSWAKYHEGTFDFSRSYSINFLNSSLFTSHGTIDNKIAAEELVRDESLGIYQRYRLACIYFLKRCIPNLWQQMPEEYRSSFYNIKGPEKVNQPELVRLWSYYLMGKINELIGREIIGKENLFWRYAFEKAVESGNEVVARCCWGGFSPRRREELVIDAAMKIIQNRARRGEDVIRSIFSNITDDRIVFRDQKYDDRKESWIPSDYYIDILCFLLSEMREDQKVKFFKKDIEIMGYSRVLKYFLDWPYQNLFMEVAKLMWEILPEKNYADLLLKITDKIEIKKGCSTRLKHREEESHDYRILLKEFWCQSSDHYKRYVLSDKKIDKDHILNQGKELLQKLFELENFNHVDEENIRLILGDATPEEKANIISSEDNRRIYRKAIEYGRFELVDLFIDLNGLSKERTLQFKKELIFSSDEKYICKNFIFKDKLELTDKFIRWSLNSEEEISNFKKVLAGDRKGGTICGSLIIEDQWQRVEEFLNWCFFSEEEMKEFKRKLAYTTGTLICDELICKSKWEQVEMFLTWVFSSEKEISDFKKKEVLKISGVCIHFELIKANKWEEAETFFAWLGLSEKEIRELKKETLFGDQMFNELMFSKEEDDEFLDYGSKQEAIALFLRWYLTDKETILEFKNYFKQQYDGGEITEEDEAVFKDFDLAIEQRLRDLAREQKGIKRKAETSLEVPNKKLCSIQLEETTVGGICKQIINPT